MEKIKPSTQMDVTISIVSHGQINLIQKLLDDIEQYCKGSLVEVILTLNVREDLPFSLDDYFYPITVICNDLPLGFGANHNQAFKHGSGHFFCVMNPDIRFNHNPFPVLQSCSSVPMVGVVAPVVLGANGDIEDSARKFPSPLKIMCKFFGKCRKSDYVIHKDLVYPDWVGGMCMLFVASTFKSMAGFDQRYFLYYEDVDLCGRLQLAGQKVVVCPQAQVIHHAQRSSHKNLRFMRWHLSSMVRFFLSKVYFKLLWRHWLTQS